MNIFIFIIFKNIINGEDEISSEASLLTIKILFIDILNSGFLILITIFVVIFLINNPQFLINKSST